LLHTHDYILGGRSEDIESFVNETQKPGFTYQDYASQFDAFLFYPEEWADLFEKSGARYVVLTSKHHDGFTLWPSKYSFSWNSVDIGPHRDIVAELAAALSGRKSLQFGLYYSLYEWFNRLYQSDKDTNFQTNDFVSHKVIPELKELVTKYQPKTLWLDGDWEPTKTNYWMATDFLEWLYNESPSKDMIVTNDRWGSDSREKHGDYYTYLQNKDEVPPKKFEYAFSIDQNSWGYNDDSSLEDYISTEDLIRNIVTTVAKGGNVLVNIGPTKRGTISPIIRERLSGMGEWLRVNGEAIYDTQKRTVFSEKNDIWYTTKNLKGIFPIPTYYFMIFHEVFL
jgi:alpha-L-fucosidase